MGWDSSESGLFVFLHPGTLERSNLTHLFQSDKVCAFHMSFSVSFPKLIAHGLEWMWPRLYLFVWGKISPGNSSMGLYIFEWNLQIVFQVSFPPIFTSFLLISNVFISTICHHHFHFSFRLPPHLRQKTHPPGSAQKVVTFEAIPPGVETLLGGWSLHRKWFCLYFQQSCFWRSDDLL